MNEQRRRTRPSTIALDERYPDGLYSVYLSPKSLSAVHVVEDNALRCLPKAPVGRLVARPDATAPTCRRCT